MATKAIEFVGKLNTYSVYWHSKYAKKDADSFVVKRDGASMTRATTLYDVLWFIQSKAPLSLAQKKRWVELAKKFDPGSASKIKGMR